MIKRCDERATRNAWVVSKRHEGGCALPQDSPRCLSLSDRQYQNSEWSGIGGRGGHSPLRCDRLKKELQTDEKESEFRIQNIPKGYWRGFQKGCSAFYFDLLKSRGFKPRLICGFVQDSRLTPECWVLLGIFLKNRYSSSGSGVSNSEGYLSQ